MISNRLLATGICVLMAAVSGRAQMNADGDASSRPNFYARNTSTANVDGIAIKGESQPQGHWGIGVEGIGGYVGVRGNSTLTGSGGRYGGYFHATGGSSNYGIYASVPSGGSNYAGFFSGNVYVSGTVTSTSDSRLKTDIQPLKGSLQKIAGLRPSSYNFDGARFARMGLPESRQIGLLAEDVHAVLPELVSEVAVPSDPAAKGAPGAAQTAYKSVNYIGLIPVLVGAIQEQQVQINALKAALAKQSR